MSVNVRATKDLKKPGELGVHHRLLCMTGPNKGTVYYLTGKRILIGRGNNADIQILDTHTSREHAELSFVDGLYIVTDLGAQNGVVINDTKIKQQRLNDNEKLVIGQSVFKYSLISVTSNKEMEIAKELPDSAIAKEIRRGKIGQNPKNLSFEVNKEETIKKKTEPNKDSPIKKIIIAIVVVAGVFVFMGEDGPKNAASKIAGKSIDKEMFNESVTVKKVSLDPESQKKLDSLIHSGRREFREANYFRAMEEFRLALILSPHNGQASFYLSKAKQKLDEEITRNFDKGTQELDAKKYQAAIVSYCGVAQLIKEYPNDERYKNAMLKISSIESSIGLEKGEIKCFEEKSSDSRD